MSFKYPLTQEEFDKIYSKVPRLTVEILLHNPEQGVFLTKRAIEPLSGYWHLPGGTVFMGEALFDAVKRVAKKEIGIDVFMAHQASYIEYPSHLKNGTGYPVGMVFVIDKYTGMPKAADHESSDASWFKTLPEPMHFDQDRFLIINGYLEPSSTFVPTT